MAMDDKCFDLKIVTPNAYIGPLSCDSLKLTVIDGKGNKHGGSYGIRKGHTNSVFALECGVLEAFKNGERILFLKTARGFARIEPELVTVTLSEATDVSQK